MPGEVHNDAAPDALDAITGRATVTATTAYLGLATAAVTDGQSLATVPELVVAGYARQAIAWDAAAGDPLQTANSALEVFGPFTANPANVTHAFVTFAASGTASTVRCFWTLDAARDADIDDSIEAAAGAVTLSLD